MPEHRFALEIDGLLRLLANHIYSTPLVALRELLQNAYDATIKRRCLGTTNYEPQITIVTNRSAGTISITDNGAGMTESEVFDCLTTIGASGTREFRTDLLGHDESSALVGYFGIGFLSSFMIASHVAVQTRSLYANHSLRVECPGSDQFLLSTVDGGEVGTTVELSLKPEARYLSEVCFLRDSIRKYADFLPVPIRLNEDPDSVNIMQPPWNHPEPLLAVREHISQTFQEEPLAIIPLRNDYTDVGHDRVTLPISGYLWIPRRFGDHSPRGAELRVYVRRMLVVEHERELLPQHAFVRGVVECEALTPTASREAIVQDDTYFAVRQAIDTQFAQAFRNISRHDPELFKEIALHHGAAMLSWAIENDDLFQELSDVLHIPTSQGCRSIPQLMKLNGGTVYYVTRRLGSLQERVLSEANGFPCVDAANIVVETFLQKYAQRHRSVRLIQLDGSSDILLRPVHDCRFDPVSSLFRDRKIRTRIAAFQPAEIPAVLICSDRAQTARDAKDAIERGDIPLEIVDLLDCYVDHVERDGDVLDGTLVINTSNSLISLLAQSQISSAKRHAAADIILQQARLFASRVLSAKEACQAFKTTGSAIEELMS